MQAQITEKGRSNASDETAFYKKIHAAPKKAHKNMHEKKKYRENSALLWT